MDKYLCFHGHFYQPPREDPWLDIILPEGSAAPSLHWNERIARESYAPLAWAHRLDGGGRVCDVVNCYEWMSFNFGPTLMRWLEGHDPATYARIIEADKASVARLGHGNAMAQICHHVIMPLATPLDRELEVAWGIQDFERRFGRTPEGMWLSEAAVDTPTLEVLAANGIRFTLLAPHQIRSVASLDEEDWRDVAAHEVNIARPYRIDLPSGRSIAVFFYHGPISQAIAFEGLLKDGEHFWRRMSADPAPGIRAVGTDGETYGHHFRFGEMALAYVLDQARAGRDGWKLTNFAAFLADTPPTQRARLHEPSSWSCVHGIERWRSDCGCSSGDHPGWNQQWRAPLRAALDIVRETADAHFFTRGRDCFADPSTALRDYGRVFCNAEGPAEFERRCFKPGIPQEKRDLGWKLLAMQRMAVSSYASCAWFFDEISRIEPLNAMAMALRALELARATGAPDVEAKVVNVLAAARSNMTEVGTGGDLWKNEIGLRRETPARLAAQGLIRLQAEGAMPDPGAKAEVSWPGVSLTITATAAEGDDADPESPSLLRSGRVTLAWSLQSDRPEYAWTLHQGDAGDLFASDITAAPSHDAPPGKASLERCVPRRDLPWNKLQSLACEWVRSAERAQWQEQVLAAISGAQLFLPWVEAQADQPLAERWSALLPALGWIFCQGLTEGQPGEPDLVRFLKVRAPGSPGITALEQRLSEEMVRLVAEDVPEDAGELLARARAIGLSPQLWGVRNALWEKRGRLAPESAGPMAELFGFAQGTL